MSDQSGSLEYPYQTAPAPGTSLEVASGVRWLRMPLPMSLDHINLYLIEDTDGWYIIDTGIRGQETQDLWLDIISNELGGKPVKRIICTHMHPDHTGQAGFLFNHCEVPLMMSHGEYYQARSMGNMMRDVGNWQMSAYYRLAGIEPAFLEQLRDMRSSFTPEAEDQPFPGSYMRLTDGDILDIGANQWQVMVGSGHSPEHVCLYAKDLRILIAGDQILPVITSNVSVHGTEPEANPMDNWLTSHERFKSLLPHDILVLPAHNLPFYGVQTRLQQLIDHHEDRMLILEEQCVEPQVAVDLLPYLFNRKLEGMTKIMALGECIAHLHCLMGRNRIERREQDGVYQYRAIDPTLVDRAKPNQHEPLDDEPGRV